MKNIVESLQDLFITEANYDRHISDKLEYRNQMDFQKYFRHRATADGYKNLVKDKRGLPHSFDHIYCYDIKTSQNIDGVVCDGSLTWGDAYDRLIKHYTEKYPDYLK